MNHEALLAEVRSTRLTDNVGTVVQVAAHVLRCRGPLVELGRLCSVEVSGRGTPVLAEAIATGDDGVVLMPYGDPTGVAAGATVRAVNQEPGVEASGSLIGRVVDGFGVPIDGGPPLPRGIVMPLAGRAINPVRRQRIRERLITGVKLIDAMLPLGCGQRVGVFAGSGVGKSTLLGMMTARVDADVRVVALIGERGREVREFIEDRLGADGLSRSVVVVATADQPAVTRARAALVATAYAEYFRDAGKRVLLVMDSVTRLAMARREIDLAAGQPPTARGYTPSVFSALPALCERAGTCEGEGSITAVYTVLAEGDDHHEPIADCLQATLDGHIWLSRELAQRGVFPAIDVLRSVSRLAGDLSDDEELAVVRAARKTMSAVERARDVVELGLYKPGSQPTLDAQLAAHRELERLFSQGRADTAQLSEVRARMNEILSQVPA